MWIEVAPAYGRDYKNQREVKADWDDDKDFRTTDTGQYVNKSGAKDMGLKVIVRYANGLKVMNMK